MKPVDEAATNLADKAARMRAGEEAKKEIEERIARILAEIEARRENSPLPPAPELTREQKVAKVATEMFNGDLVRAEAFMRGSEVRDAIIHKQLGKDY